MDACNWSIEATVELYSEPLSIVFIFSLYFAAALTLEIKASKLNNLLFLLLIDSSNELIRDAHSDAKVSAVESLSFNVLNFDLYEES